MSEGFSKRLPGPKLKEWLEKGYGVALRTVQRLGLTPADAEDVVHDALIGLLLGEQEFDSYEKFVAYLSTTARWRALDSWRRIRRQAVPESQLTEVDRARFAEHPDPAYTDTESVAEQNELEREISRLPDRSREVMTLALEGFDSFEIGQRLGIKPASVRSLLRFARYRLAKRIR